MFDGGEIPVAATSFAVVAALLLLRRFSQSKVKDDGKRNPPSLPILPFIGAVLRGGMSAVPEYYMRTAEKLGPVFSCPLGNRTMVVLNGYDAIYDALVRHSEAFADRDPIWTEAKLVNPEHRGISFAQYNDTFKKYHKLALSILKEFGFGVQRVSETRILQEVESMNNEILKHNGRSFDPKSIVVFSTSNFILSILFGKEFLHSMPKEHLAMVETSGEYVANIDMTLNLTPIVRFLPMFWKTIDNLRTTSKKLMAIMEVGINFNKSNSSESTFINRFLEIEGASYNHQDLLYILRDTVTASTDTVATTLLWAMVELANHPDTQARFQREIDEMVPEDRLPSLDDKPRMPYTEALVLELLRRRSVVPLYVPHASLRDTKVLEYDIPKGCMVIANGYSANMDRVFWKDPENFRPERFLDEDNKIINSQRLASFGFGKRSCLGEVLARQSTFLFLTSLVQRFDIRPQEGQKTINVKEHIGITLSPTQFEVRLIPRGKPTES